jgi:SAM-dependent methyltransferase
MTPRLITYAQQNDWLGRRILDLGCGTGVASAWLSQNGYMVTGVDSAPAMLQAARSTLRAQHVDARLVEQDIRALSGVEMSDMALALGVINELESLRDLETVFRAVAAVIPVGKLFIFDLHTVEGLTRRGLNGGEITLDADDLAVAIQTTFDFERQLCQNAYLIFTRNAGESWSRQRAQQVLRAYPLQAVVTLLRRSGFEARVLDERLTPNIASAPRVFFIAARQ